MNVKPSPLLAQLVLLVCKTGVGLAGLSAEQQRLALAVAAACIELGVVQGEVRVTEALRACLAAEAGFLALDAAELRRWLIDTGWWIRDGYGRAYQRLPVDALPAELQPAARAVQGLVLREWVPTQRAAVQALRAARHQRWLETQREPGEPGR